MSRLGYTVELVENEQKIKQLVLKALQRKIAPLFRGISLRIQENLRRDVEVRIKAQPEYDSLLSGKLKGELGLDRAENRVNAIINLFVESINVSATDLNVVGDSLRGTIQIRGGNYQDLVKHPEAVIVAPPTRQAPYPKELYWLEALLLWGGRIIVRDFDVEFATGKGRSRIAHMVPEAGARWSVPDEFQGTPQDNWFTRAFEGFEKNLIQLIKDTIK